MAPARSPFAMRGRKAGWAAPFGQPGAPGSKSYGGGNKFGAKGCACSAGHQHPSKAEARRCDQLHLLARAGVIRDLEVQPQFWFVIPVVREVNGKVEVSHEQVKHEGGRRVGYRADFAYREARTDGAFRHVVEDVKGAYRDDAWTLRKAIFRALFPAIELREVP